MGLSKVTSGRRLPTAVLLVSGVVLIAGVVMTLVGSYQIGSTWDEKTNMQSLQVFFDQGWNITADALIDGEPNPDYIWGIYVYGPVSLLFTHALSTLAGVESWGQISFSSQAYAARHVGGAVIGLLGVVAGAFIVRLLTRSWRWSLLAAATLVGIPMWTGHSMMNIKDGPVGTGYTVATLGLVLIMRQDYLQRWSVRFLGLFALFGGALIGAGTRAASGIPIAGSAVLAAALWWLIMRRDSACGGRALRLAFRRLVESGLALFATYLALVALYPNAWKNPFTLAYQAGVVSAKFPFSEPIMFAGSWVDQPVPWTYLPGWFLAQLPLLVTIAGVFFVVWWAYQAVHALRATQAFDRSFVVQSSPVLLQALLLPVVAVIVQTTMYNAVRQFVFVVPAAAVLGTMGVWVLIRWMREHNAAKPWFVAAWILVSAGLVAPTVSQVLLYPYTYVYFNAAAAARPIDGNWSTDYWRASSNELMRKLPANGPESCAYEQTRKGEVMPCSDEPMFEPYLAERGSAARPGKLSDGEYWLVRENQGRTEIPEGCVLHDSITRPLFWQTITIGQIFQCQEDAVIPANGNLPSD